MAYKTAILNHCRSKLPALRLQYINIAGNDLYRPNLFKPAPYILEDTTISTKCLFRLRTQHSIEFPTHQHLTTASGSFGYTKYEDRHCPSALPAQ